MKKVIIIHGWSGSPNGDWLPWLKSELEKEGCEVLVPEMPNADAPVVEKWVDCLANAGGEAGPDEDTFFVGHSMGCQTILRYLDSREFESRRTVGGAIFVAGWFYLENLEDDGVRAIAKPWLENFVSPAKIRKILPKSTLIISDNDPYNALEKNKEKFLELGSKIIELPNAGHITAGDGFTEVPKILSELGILMGK
ncbi:serine hydrolase family protein [bacterium]|nr:MAG: serine hydrolase family protein [bacterium]